jgi:hypothetical protein
MHPFIFYLDPGLEKELKRKRKGKGKRKRERERKGKTGTACRRDGLTARRTDRNCTCGCLPPRTCTPPRPTREIGAIILYLRMPSMCHSQHFPLPPSPFPLPFLPVHPSTHDAIMDLSFEEEPASPTALAPEIHFCPSNTYTIQKLSRSLQPSHSSI